MFAFATVVVTKAIPFFDISIRQSIISDICCLFPAIRQKIASFMNFCPPKFGNARGKSYLCTAKMCTEG